MVNTPVSTGVGATHVLLEGLAVNPTATAVDDIEDCNELLLEATADTLVDELETPTTLLDVEEVDDEPLPHAVSDNAQKKINNVLVVILLFHRSV